MCPRTPHGDCPVDETACHIIPSIAGKRVLITGCALGIGNSRGSLRRARRPPSDMRHPRRCERNRSIPDFIRQS